MTFYKCLTFNTETLFTEPYLFFLTFKNHNILMTHANPAK